MKPLRESIRGGVLHLACISLGLLLLHLVVTTEGYESLKCEPGQQPPDGQWYTKQSRDGIWGFYNDALGQDPQTLRGVSLTGFESGVRGNSPGSGFWMFTGPKPTFVSSKQIIRNIMRTLIIDWGVSLIRVPVCGSSWLQNYQLPFDDEFGKPVRYRDWVDIAICEITSLGGVAIFDLHFWAIGNETIKTKDDGMEDGCTGITVIADTDACAPHDWYGEYTSGRTGKTYNEGDSPTSWQCPFMNGDGCTLENVLRNNNTEHFMNFWWEAAHRYKNNSYVWFELFNEPYQRKSAEWGKETGSYLAEAEYDWQTWSDIMHEAITIIREIADNVMIVAGLDWNYDYLGDPLSNNPGPILMPRLVPWKYHINIAYAMHPYLGGTCCGQIGNVTDLSAMDPYESAYCMYPPLDDAGGSIASNSSLPAEGAECTMPGYTSNKKVPPCNWVPQAQKWNSSDMGLCAGDRDLCGELGQKDCMTTEWSEATAGGWSMYVYPMQKMYGPIVATEFGTLDCSSPFVSALMRYSERLNVSFTAWALWPENYGGFDSLKICSYPSIMEPRTISGEGFGRGVDNCQTREGCSKIIQPMAWAGKAVADAIKRTTRHNNPNNNIHNIENVHEIVPVETLREFLFGYDEE